MQGGTLGLSRSVESRGGSHPISKALQADTNRMQTGSRREGIRQLCYLLKPQGSAPFLGGLDPSSACVGTCNQDGQWLGTGLLPLV